MQGLVERHERHLNQNHKCHLTVTQEKKSAVLICPLKLSWMSVQHFTAIHQITVNILLPGPNWSTDRPTFLQPGMLKTIKASIIFLCMIRLSY